jgi:hypothetical protein
MPYGSGLSGDSLRKLCVLPLRSAFDRSFFSIGGEVYELPKKLGLVLLFGDKSSNVEERWDKAEDILLSDNETKNVPLWLISCLVGDKSPNVEERFSSRDKAESALLTLLSGDKS